MSFEVIMPALGMAQDTGHLVSWAKSVGDVVSEDDVLMEVETDKTTMEVPAGHSGYVAELRASAGDDVPVGNVIAVITQDKPTGETVSSTVKKTPIKAKVTAPIAPQIEITPTRTETRIVASSTDDKILASPKLKRLAHEAGHDLSQLSDIGLQQPFHVGDLEKLSNLPTAAATPGDVLTYGPAVSLIEAKVPTAGLDGFITRMQEEADIAVEQKSLWLSFASSALRNCLQINDIIIDVIDITGQIIGTYQNADSGGLNGQKMIESIGAPDIILRDFSDGYITKAHSGIHAQMELCVNNIGDNFEISLSYRETTMDAELAIQFVNDFCKKLSNPLVGLI
jgi:hypothetical protein